MKSFLEIDFHNCDRIDMSLRHEGKETKVYLGRGSSVIVFPLHRLDDFITFLKQARTELEIKS